MGKKNERQLREPDYLNREPRPYNELCDKEYFSKVIDFSNNTQLSVIKEELENLSDYRVWLLYAGNDGENWECLQVAHSKNGVKEEISDDINFLISANEYYDTKTEYTQNSAFYKGVCPKVSQQDYRKALYSRIGQEYRQFRICLLNVDKYLGINPDNNNDKTDVARIIRICKNQYAEAKIAYETLAVYWRHVSSGIDGQTIADIAENSDEYNAASNGSDA